MKMRSVCIFVALNLIFVIAMFVFFGYQLSILTADDPPDDVVRASTTAYMADGVLAQVNATVTPVITIVPTNMAATDALAGVRAIDLLCLSGDTLTPEMFIDNLPAEVTASFANTPDFSTPGVYPVEILLTDAEGTIDSINPTFEVIAGTTAVQIELGSALTVYDFVPDADEIGAVLRNPLELTGEYSTGVYNMSIAIGEYVCPVSCEIRDSLAPSAVPADTVPPVISGVHDISIIQNETVAYKKGISVADDYDDSPSLKVDSNTVITTVPGIYTVTYTAEDRAGNRSDVTASVVVSAVEASDVDPLIASIANEIITPGMSQRSMAKAIRRYVTTNVSYRQKGIHDELYLAAYTGIKKGAGDCYTYYAMSDLLLTYVGIENIPIRRVSSARTKHYWSLVRFDGEDEWYHYDSSVHNASYTNYIDAIEWSAFTETQAQAYTYVYDEINKTNHQYYDYEMDEYPMVDW